MKNIFTILVAFFLSSVSLFAQSPKAFKYQAVVRNSSGTIIPNQAVNFRIGLLLGSDTGMPMYVEENSGSTNAFGLVNLEIGKGTPVLNFIDSVHWSLGPVYIKIEMDAAGGSNFSLMGTSQLLSVPYALHAKTAESISGGIIETDPIFGISPAYGISATNIINWSSAYDWGNHAGLYMPFNYVPAWTELSGKPTTIAGYGIADAFDGNYNSLNNKPTLFDGDYNNLLNQPPLFNGSWTSLSGMPTTITGYGITDAFDGNYNSLSNLPVLFSGAYSNLTGAPTLWDSSWVSIKNKPTLFDGNYNSLINAPANVSNFNNDAGYITGFTEAQALRISNDTIFLTNGGFVKINISALLLPPSAICVSATNLQSFSATINAIVNGKGLKTTVDFEWGLTNAYGNVVTASQSPVTGNSDVAVNTNLTALQSATTYHYRIKAANAVNDTYSNDMFFTTLPSAPQLITTSISSIAGISASSGGNITYDGGDAVTAFGVCWSTVSIPTLADNSTNDGAGTGSFSSSITGLALGTTYYVRAYATNSVGTTYGNEFSFTTVALPSLTTTAVFSITSIAATSGGNITFNGGSAITERGICWSIAANPTITDSHTADGTGSGAFTSSITGLTLGNTYYVRAYATNVAGIIYGNEVSFTTTPGIGENYQGGIIAYILQAGDPGFIIGERHGIIAAPSDQSTSIRWHNGTNTTTGAIATVLGTGNANTNTIVANQGAGAYAAQLCADLVLGGYSDWYLPSKDELNKLYLSMDAIGCGSHIYWTSSERDFSQAWEQYFHTDNGTIPSYSKSSPAYVRAVRSF